MRVPVWAPLLRRTVYAARLLRAVEEAHVSSLAENVALYRFHHVDASVEWIGAGLNVDFLIERVNFENVMMPRAGGGRAGTSIHQAAGAHLISAILQLRTHGDAFGKPGGASGNIPYQPVELIVGGVVAAVIDVMHVQKERHRAGGTLVHVSSGDVWVPACVYFGGMSVPSAKALVAMRMGGAAGAAGAA